MTGNHEFSSLHFTSGGNPAAGRKPRPTAVAGLLLLLTGPLFAQCSLEIATVADFRGRFVDSRNGHVFARNDVVCSESRIERDKKSGKSSEDFISLKPRQGGEVQTYRCKEQLGCEKPFDLSSLTESAMKSLAGSSLLQSIEEWWNARGRATTTISGQRSAAPAASVLKHAAVAVNAPIAARDVFRDDAPAGEYPLDLCPHATDSECGDTIPSARRIVWQRGAAGNLPFATSASGIYLLYRVTANAAEVRLPGRVLVVVVPAERAEWVAVARARIAAAEKAAPPEGVPQEAYVEAYVRYLASVLTAPN